MAKTNMAIKKYRGYKFFKELENGEIEIIRLMGICLFNDRVHIMNEETKEWKTVNYYTLKEYTPLEPYGVLGVSVVQCNMSDKYSMEDVIVTLYKKIELEISKQITTIPPFAICRQGVSDFFYNMISKKEDHGIVGVSVTRDNCPSNIPYDMMAACDEVKSFELIHLYRDDTLDTMLLCLGYDLSKCNDTLDKLYKTHCYSLPIPVVEQDTIYKNLEEHSGWCKNLRKLLTMNNFIVDFNTMCGITGVDFILEDCLISEGEDKKLNPEVLMFFCKTFHVNAVDTFVIQYGYDIDLADFNNQSYTLLKDVKDIIYIVVYTTEGEYLEKDLEEKQIQMDVTDRLRLSYYDKYSGQTEE